MAGCSPWNLSAQNPGNRSGRRAPRARLPPRAGRALPEKAAVPVAWWVAGGAEVRILVTGGTGFLGSHLVARLLADGHSVRVLGRSPPEGSLGANAEFFPGDLRDPEPLRRATAKMEVIYHLAGLVSFDPRDGRAMYELHVDGTRRLLEAAEESGARRIILASTSGTIAVSSEEAIANEDNDHPIAVVGKWPYYLSKIYQEKLALRFRRGSDLGRDVRAASHRTQHELPGALWPAEPFDRRACAKAPVALPGEHPGRSAAGALVQNAGGGAPCRSQI